MSSAAPSAGPAPAPAAAPAAAPSTGQPTVTPDGTPVVASPRTIKPIPPSRPRLPGVLDDGPEDARTRPPVEGRDAQGRFVKGEPKTAAEPAAPEPTIPDLPDAAPTFKFAGREFKSQAEAEHWAKSMEGRYKPIQEAATRDGAQLVKAAESARGWHSEAQRLAARVAELEKGVTTPPNGATTPDSGTTVPNQGIDWSLYAEIAKVANEAGEPWKAQQWLQEQVDAQRASERQTYLDEVARLRDEAIEAPRREAEAQEQLSATADTLVESMAAHTNPDGSPAFPEFRDGEQARAVGELWSSLGLDPQLALTPGGAVAAVALYRMARGMDVAQPAALPPTPPDPAAEAAAGLEGGRPLMPAATGRSTLDPATARLVAGLKSREMFKPGLGFEA